MATAVLYTQVLLCSVPTPSEECSPSDAPARYQTKPAACDCDARGRVVMPYSTLPMSRDTAQVPCTTPQVVTLPLACPGPPLYYATFGALDGPPSPSWACKRPPQHGALSSTTSCPAVQHPGSFTDAHPVSPCRRPSRPLLYFGKRLSLCAPFIYLPTSLRLNH